MRITKKVILIVLVLFQSFISIANARPFGGGDPFALGVSRGSEKQMSEDLKKWGNQIFGFRICMVAYKGNLSNLKMNIMLPPEVEKRKAEYETAWEGRLSPDQEKCLNPGLKSKIDIKQWSSDISAHVEFTHEGFKYKRDITWGPSGFKDSGFVEVK